MLDQAEGEFRMGRSRFIFRLRVEVPGPDVASRRLDRTVSSLSLLHRASSHLALLSALSHLVPRSAEQAPLFPELCPFPACSSMSVLNQSPCLHGATGLRVLQVKMEVGGLAFLKPESQVSCQSSTTAPPPLLQNSPQHSSQECP
jgi:hypothetical protein